MKPVVLCILDGVGYSEKKEGNAFLTAHTPNYDYLWNNYPHSLLESSGNLVGLPVGQMGNSEVGHMNMGAGRIIYQPLELINKAIKDKTFYHNETLIEAMNEAKKNNSKLHIMGLISNGGVHSSIDHIIALLKLAKEQDVNNVYFHCFTDGRDTLPNISLTFLKQLESAIEEIGIGVIATISGRYYAMDRDERWDRTNLAYDAIVNAIGSYNPSIELVIEESYKKEIYDEFIVPTVINKEGTIEDKDVVIIGNFRSDRLIQLSNALTEDNFDKFEVKKLPNIKLITMMAVAKVEEEIPAFKLDEINNTLGEYISSLSLKQLRIAETEKYAHVTFFFDGQKDLTLPGYDKVLIPSPKVATYELTPEMSAYKITEKAIDLINNYDLVILNYANGDMIGHTGNFNAAIKACEVLDDCLGKLYQKIKEIDGLLIVTADHGNCDDMTGLWQRTHTTNPVPFILCNNNYQLKSGKLADIAPTILKIMNIEIPKEMTGDILIK